MSVNSAIITKISMFSSPKSEDIKFISQTASLTIKTEQTSQGWIKKHTLSFKIAGIDDATELLTSKITKCRIFTATDAHNFTTIIGRPDFPPSAVVESDTAGYAGGTRGYSVTITWNSI